MDIIIQQGDCLLKKCGEFGYFKVEHKEIPKGAKLIKGNLLLKGQTNSHALYGGKFELRTHNGVTFLDVKKETKLDHVQDHRVAKPKHAEHHAQKIPVGQYFLDGVMEYDHQKEEARVVIDQCLLCEWGFMKKETFQEIIAVQIGVIIGLLIFIPIAKYILIPFLNWIL